MVASNVVYRLTPNAVRDLVGGTAGIGVWVTAIIGGCVVTSPTTSIWFAFSGVTGVLSLIGVAPQLGNAIRARPDCVPDDSDDIRRAA